VNEFIRVMPSDLLGDGTSDELDAPTPAPLPWPEQVAEEALQGLAGEFVRLVEPHTESDPVALLVQFLVAAGNVIGPGAYARVEGDEHPARLFAVLVGRTAGGRKGTSWGRVRRFFETVDRTWATNCARGGLSSGEGLIYHVRDGDDEKDEGISDKRLLAAESEFAGVLKITNREGNTLSPVLRAAWDQGGLSTLTRNSPLKATGAHVSVLGHITGQELKRRLEETEISNGFANRFLWIAVKRSKELPEGGRLQDSELESLAERTRAAVDFARSAGEVRRDPEARKIWASVYGELSAERPGLLGAVTSRAEAQVLRLSVLYAVLDRSTVVRPEHLTAALSVWEYAMASARHVFGDATGNRLAEKIAKALGGAPDGLTHNEIRELVGNAIGAPRIDGALSELESAGRIHQVKVETGGRPATRYRGTR